MRRSVRRLRLAVAAGVAMAAVSCGEKGERLPETGASLEGTVKYGGEPVQFAVITVQAGTNGASGRVGEDGRYKVENVPLGQVTVMVDTEAAKGDFIGRSMAAGAYKGPEAKAGGKAAGVKFVSVPEKYTDPAKSGITTTVNPGPNTFDIVIPK